MERARHTRTIAVGGWWGLGTMGIALPYALLAGGPHRGTLIAAALAGVVMSVALALAAPRFPMLIRRRRPVMLAYSTAHVVLTFVLAVADGGADSPMALGFFGTFTFAAYTMPARWFVGFGALNVAAYLSVYLAAGADRPEFVPVQLAGMLATASACAVQHATAVRQRRALSAAARTDPLTRCLNRRGFGERLTAELAAAVRHDRGLSLLVIDLDGFKAINDTRGHAAGDAVLEQTADALRAELREHDAVGRLGGDEFAVLLADTDPFGAATTAARLRARVGATVPASLGIAHLGIDGDSGEALMAAADQVLYADKRDRAQPVGVTR